MFNRSKPSQTEGQPEKVNGIEGHLLDSVPESDVTANGSITRSPLPSIPDIRVTPRTLHLPESRDVALAALQYFYTQALCTPLQHQLPVLVGLLLFSRTYSEPNLRALTVHALHGVLLNGPSNAPAQVYEAATLVGAIALQVRSLKQLMNASRGHRHRPSSDNTGRKGIAVDS